MTGFIIVMGLALIYATYSAVKWCNTAKYLDELRASEFLCRTHL